LVTTIRTTASPLASTRSGRVGIVAPIRAGGGSSHYLLEDAAYRELRFAGRRSNQPAAGFASGDYAALQQAVRHGARVGFGYAQECSRWSHHQGQPRFWQRNLLQQLMARVLRRRTKPICRRGPALRAESGRHGAGFARALSDSVQWMNRRAACMCGRGFRQVQGRHPIEVLPDRAGTGCPLCAGELCYADDLTAQSRVTRCA